MVSLKLEKILQSEFKKQIGIFEGAVSPSLQVRVFKSGEKVAEVDMGESASYYDIASLTKIICTSTLFMAAYEKDDKILEQKILTYLPWFFHPNLSLRQLLTHTTGLVAHKPFYIHLNMDSSREERWKMLRDFLSQEKPDILSTKALYSDLNYLLLGFFLEEKWGQDLFSLMDLVKEEFQLSNTHFHKENVPVYSLNKYAPTENCLWRNKRLIGEVHDENAWALGGVSSHAGLFSSMDDLSKWFLKLRGIFVAEQKGSFISEDTLKTFWQRAITKNHGDWALGFMMPSEKGSTAGQKFSKNSIGHTGFTGTSFWYDPKVDLAVFILSNRVYFGRDNRDSFNQIRMKIHDVCYQELVG